MNNDSDKYPIIVGVGESVEHLLEDMSQALSAHELAAKAAKAALDDALSSEKLATEVDVIVATRTFPDSNPAYQMPFGRSNNIPRSIARRIGAQPKKAIYCKIGGDSPQRLVGEWAEHLVDGNCEMVLLAGAEAIASTKAAIRNKLALDWSESIEGDLEDAGIGLEGLVSQPQIQHNLLSMPLCYGLCENARRVELGASIQEYTQQMAETLAPFSNVAASHPYAMFPKAMTAEEIATPTESNGMVAFPYTKAMVAKDGVNQGAAVLLTTVGKAKALGIDPAKWIYLHAYSVAREKPLLSRNSLGHSPALQLAIQQAMSLANIAPHQLHAIDVYSCFPIVVSSTAAALDIEHAEKPLTQTGGLPFFGGPGNNYSMHGIAAVVQSLRQQPDSYGLVSANGGAMDKHAIGIYSNNPGWQRCDSSELQRQLDAMPAVELEYRARGDATIESYTVQYHRGTPLYGIVIGRLTKNNKRFIANNFEKDQAMLQALLDKDMAGKKVVVDYTGKGNRVALDAKSLQAQMPTKAIQFRESYEFCSININGHILEITLDRPDSMNALHPPAHEELDEIFDIFESTQSLWVAIITGAGERSFCTGNDLKWSASGKPLWFPLSGFAGICARRRCKPVIAAVNGAAMGGGFEIALACDIIIADENAVFALPEVKVGLIAAAGGIQRLTRQIPLKQAMDILLTGRNISAEEGKQLGFINQICSSGSALSTARSYAEVLCQNSPTSVRLTRELLNETASHAAIDDAVDFVPKMIDKLIASEDMIEGPKAFAEKRKPNWSGR